MNHALLWRRFHFTTRATTASNFSACVPMWVAIARLQASIFTLPGPRQGQSLPDKERQALKYVTYSQTWWSPCTRWLDISELTKLPTEAQIV